VKRGTFSAQGLRDTFRDLQRLRKAEKKYGLDSDECERELRLIAKILREPLWDEEEEKEEDDRIQRAHESTSNNTWVCEECQDYCTERQIRCPRCGKVRPDYAI